MRPIFGRSPNGANFGHCRQYAVEPRPHLTSIGPIPELIAQHRPNMSSLGKSRPNSAEVADTWSNTSEKWPTGSVEFAPTWPNLDQNCPQPCQRSPKWAHVGRSRPVFAESEPNFTSIRPKLHQLGPHAAGNCQMSAESGPHYFNSGLVFLGGRMWLRGGGRPSFGPARPRGTRMSHHVGQACKCHGSGANSSSPSTAVAAHVSATS